VEANSLSRRVLVVVLCFSIFFKNMLKYRVKLTMANWIEEERTRRIQESERSERDKRLAAQAKRDAELKESEERIRIFETSSILSNIDRIVRRDLADVARQLYHAECKITRRVGGATWIVDRPNSSGYLEISVEISGGEAGGIHSASKLWSESGTVGRNDPHRSLHRDRFSEESLRSLLVDYFEAGGSKKDDLYYVRREQD